VRQSPAGCLFFKSGVRLTFVASYVFFSAFMSLAAIDVSVPLPQEPVEKGRTAFPGRCFSMILTAWKGRLTFFNRLLAVARKIWLDAFRGIFQLRYRRKALKRGTEHL
jgi:hypothetical protein